jgi:hypothetical protein
VSFALRFAANRPVKRMLQDLLSSGKSQGLNAGEAIFGGVAEGLV